MRLPFDDFLAGFIRRHIEGDYRMWTNPTGGSLMKIIDFSAVMFALQPLFDCRWRIWRQCAATLGYGPSEAAATEGTRFTLRCEIGGVGFEIGALNVLVADSVGAPYVTIPLRWLSGMITGYHSIAELAVSNGVKIPRRLVGLLQILFPRAWAFVYQGDNY